MNKTNNVIEIADFEDVNVWSLLVLQDIFVMISVAILAGSIWTIGLGSLPVIGDLLYLHQYKSWAVIFTSEP